MFKPMSETEIAISKIKDVKMIQIYDLTGSADLQGEACVPAATVYYGDNQNINLSKFDEHFDLLIDKIYALYKACEDKSSLMLDAKTRAFLESGETVPGEHMLAAYYEREGSLFPEVPFASTLSRRWGGFIEYLLHNLYKAAGQEVETSAVRYGWRGNVEINARRGGQALRFLARISEVNESKLSMRVLHFPEEGESLEISVAIGRETIDIAYASEDGVVRGTEHYHATYETLTECHEVFFRDKQSFFEETASAPAKDLTEKEKKLLWGLEGEFVVYRLPWGMAWIFGCQHRDSAKMKVTDYTETILFDGGYADIKGRTQFINTETGLTITADSLHFCRLQLKDGRWQTGFLPAMGNVTGTYKEQLAGRFFMDDIKMGEQ